MAPKRAGKMVVRSTKKVVQVSIVGSSKRLTRRNKDAQLGGEGVTLGEGPVRTIPVPVQEVTPQPKEDASSTFSAGDKTEEEATVNGQEPTKGTFLGAQKQELLEPTTKKEQVKKGKTEEGVNSKEKRKRKRGRSSEGYQRYVYRVLKQVHPEMGISSKAMTVLNNLMNDMFERLADEAAKLKTYTGHMTLSSREIQGAVKLVLPGELGKHAIAEGVKAVTTYMSIDA